jgi:hypothetical protein
MKIENEFIPYEQALTLKELGFDEECFGIYTVTNKKLFIVAPSKNESFGYLNTPTFSQCFKWFREKYQIFPEVLTDCTTEPKFVYTYNTFYGNPKDLTEQEWGWENNIGQYSDIYRTYEDAELECLKKIIEIVKSKSE